MYLVFLKEAWSYFQKDGLFKKKKNQEGGKKLFVVMHVFMA